MGEAAVELNGANLERLDTFTDELHRLAAHIRVYYGELNTADASAAKRILDAGLGSVFAIKNHDEHNVLYPALEIGIFQADLKAASENRPFAQADSFEHIS